jgi:hypothetical protein
MTPEMIASGKAESKGTICGCIFASSAGGWVALEQCVDDAEVGGAASATVRETEDASCDGVAAVVVVKASRRVGRRGLRLNGVDVYWHPV